MDKQTRDEIVILKDKINELGQKISIHYMGLHAESNESINIDQDALIELDERLTAIEEMLKSKE